MAIRPKNLANTYIPPSSPYLKPILLCGVIMALSTRREFVSPGSPLYDFGLSRSATAVRYATYVQDGLFYLLFSAHGIETAVFMKRLKEHGISVGSLAWWKWVGTCFAGGKFCFEHFDRVAGRTGA